MAAMSDDELRELAGLMSSPSMYQIAIAFVKLDSDELDTIDDVVRSKMWKFNFTILKMWKLTMKE